MKPVNGIGGETCLVGFANECLDQLNGHTGSAMLRADRRVDTQACCLPLDFEGRHWVAMVPAPNQNRYRPDVAQFARAYGQAVSQAIATGCRKIQLLPPQNAALAIPCLIEALDLQALEEAAVTLDLSLFKSSEREWAERIAKGKSLARQITETTPDVPISEQIDAIMTSLTLEAVSITRVGPEQVLKQYTLCGAVSEATWECPARRPEILRITIGSPKASRAVFLAGKGVVMDTGGLDLKRDGQFGMSRDKGGAGALAGFLSVAANAVPDDLCIHAELGFVWNGIGGAAITPDHILTSAGGVRIQVGNTDAEGRLILSDLLNSLLHRRRACSAIGAEFLALATLTGHAGRAFGARAVLVGDDRWQQSEADKTLLTQCETMGERAAVSPLRPEDWAVSSPVGPGKDLIGATKANSVATSRGHQYPAAVIKTASGWFNMQRPSGDGFLLADIAGANMRIDLPGQRSAAPMVAGLTARYLMSKASNA